MAVSRRKINEMYERALASLDAVFGDLPAGSGGKAAADGLRNAFALIREKGEAQTGFADSAKVGTGERSAARFNIREYRRRLAETANIIARQKAGFNRNYPTASSETDEELITQTRAVAAKALESKADFIRRGLTQEYLESGTELVEAFQTALKTTNESLSQRGEATGGKRSAHAEAADFFDELDIFIRNYYRDQPDKLNAWRNAARIERTAAKNNEETPLSPGSQANK